MPFNLVSNHIYTFQLWVCTSMYLKLYKVKQIHTYVLHNILHVIFYLTWCLTCILNELGHICFPERNHLYIITHISKTYFNKLVFIVLIEHITYKMIIWIPSRFYASCQRGVSRDTTEMSTGLYSGQLRCLDVYLQNQSVFNLLTEIKFELLFMYYNNNASIQINLNELYESSLFLKLL